MSLCRMLLLDGPRDDGRCRYVCAICKGETDWIDPAQAVETPKCKSRGLGDTLARIINVVTLGLVKPCGGCKQRQEKLNELVQYTQAVD